AGVQSIPMGCAQYRAGLNSPAHLPLQHQGRVTQANEDQVKGRLDRLARPITSEMEAVLHLHSEFAGIGEVRTSESAAVVKHVMVVADVESAEAKIPVLAKGLSERQVDGSVAWEMLRAVAVDEPGTIV